MAHGSARNLLAIINDILDFSKIEAERLDLEDAPFSLRSLLDEVTETFRAKVIEKHVELVTWVGPDVPDRLVGDALRLRQILTNLVGNAFKFTASGEVVVRVTSSPCPERAEEPKGSPLTAFGSHSPCATPASASRPTSRGGCSKRSARPTVRPRGSTAAPASASPSAGAWPG